MTDWKLGQYVRVWRSQFHGDDGGYEYGHIESFDPVWRENDPDGDLKYPGEVMLVGDDGREIFAQVKDLEEG